MNKKKFLASFTLLASTVLLFACQSNESTTKSSEKLLKPPLRQRIQSPRNKEISG